MPWETGEGGKKIPARITAQEFRRYFLASFPALVNAEYDGLIEEAIGTVYAMFTGISTIWDMHEEAVWYEKTHTCYRLLLAWYIADQYPELTSNVILMGGVPLRRKKVDGVDLEFAATQVSRNPHYEDLLEALRSNSWGNKARMMIKAAAKRMALRNRRIV